MAEPIRLSASGISSYDAKKAASAVEQAVNYLQQVKLDIDFKDSFSGMSMFPNTQGELRSILSVLEKKKETIDALVTVFSNGTQKIEDADAEFRYDMVPESNNQKIIKLLLGTHYWLYQLFSTNTEIKNALTEWEHFESLLEEKFDSLDLYEKELLKDIAKEAFGTGYDIYDISECIEDGDFGEAIKKLGKKITKKGLESVYAVLFNDLNIAAVLRADYTLNLLELGTESALNLIEKPSWKNVFGLFWSTTAAPVLQTAGDTAYDVLTLFPGLTDWYEERGATDMGGVFNVAYEEVTRLIYGDECADFVGNYYGDHGGIVDGLWDGFKEIVDFTKDFGFKEMLKCTWTGLFG